MDQPSVLFSSHTRRTPIISKMFVPVVNKDMQLFPAHRQTLPPRIKNVRSRAQSLEDNLQAVNHVMNGNAPSATANTIATRSRVVPTGRQRNAQSVGSLPTSPALALIPPAKSPPKLSSSGSMRKPLDPIVEGVPLASSAPLQKQISECSSKPVNKKKKASESSNNGHCDDSHTDNKENPSSSSCTTPSSNKSTPDLHDLRIRPSSSLSTASAPGLEKTGTSPPNSSSSGGKGIVKWITNTLKGKNGSRDKESTNGGGKQPVESPQSNGGSTPLAANRRIRHQNSAHSLSRRCFLYRPPIRVIQTRVRAQLFITIVFNVPSISSLLAIRNVTYSFTFVISTIYYLMSPLDP